MPDLKIPKDDRRGLLLLQNMSEPTWKALLVEVERSAGTVPAVKDLSQEDAKHAMDTIKSMYRVRAHHEVPLDEFISDICDALREQNELQADVEPQFRQRLTKILDLEVLNVRAKASSLGSEYEHLFCSARIITDARPVYGTNVSEPPTAMVVTHTLKIEYHEADGRLKEIYIGLGSQDIEELATVVGRAKEKSKSLQGALRESKIRFIDPQQD